MESNKSRSSIREHGRPISANANMMYQSKYQRGESKFNDGRTMDRKETNETYKKYQSKNFESGNKRGGFSVDNSKQNSMQTVELTSVKRRASNADIGSDDRPPMEKRSRIAPADGDQQMTTTPNRGVELRLLIPCKWIGSIIGEEGRREHIKALRNRYNAAVNVIYSRSPERILSIVAENYFLACQCLRDVLRGIAGDYGNEMDIRLMVYKGHVGAIIGHSGMNIQQLRTFTSTIMRIYPQCAPLSTERVLQIIGDVEKCADAIGMVMDICAGNAIIGPIVPYDTMNYGLMNIEEYGGCGSAGSSMGGASAGGAGGRAPRAERGFKGPRFPPPMNPRPAAHPMSIDDGPKETTQVTIPSQFAGCIIGVGGEVIKSIHAQSGAEIDIHDGTAGCDTRLISIKGTKRQIRMTEYLMQQCILSTDAGRRYAEKNAQRQKDYKY